MLSTIKCVRRSWGRQQQQTFDKFLTTVLCNVDFLVIGELAHVRSRFVFGPIDIIAVLRKDAAAAYVSALMFLFEYNFYKG